MSSDYGIDCLFFLFSFELFAELLSKNQNSLECFSNVKKK